MKLPPFEYRDPVTVDEVMALLTEAGDEAKILAGGQSLIPLLALRMARPSMLIDINRVDGLAGITANGTVEIGATTRHRAAETSAVIQAHVPMLAHALGHVGHVAIRTRGTLGGSVAHADPAAEIPTVMAALGGSVVAASSRGRREIPAGDFFQGFLTTALDPDELLVAVRFPALARSAGWAFNEFSRRNGDFAIVSVAVLVELDSTGDIAEARVAVSGVATEPVRVTDAEAVLRGASPEPDVLEAAGAAASQQISPTSDLHGTAAYRRHLTGALVRRGLDEALERAKGRS